MKNISNIKIIALSSIMSLSLIGCGSSSRDSDNYITKQDNLNPISITGRVVDGYLQNSTVCLDLDRNGVCNGVEPFVLSGDNGRYNLEISVDIQKKDNYKNAPIIAYDGIDVDTQDKFIGVLSSPNSGTLTNITPITTLIQKRVESGDSLDNALNNLSKIINVDKSKLLLDPVDEYNKGDAKLIQNSIAIQKAVEAVAIKRENSTKEEIGKIYDSLAKELKSSTNNLDELISSSLSSDEVTLAKSVSNKIEKAFSDIPNQDEKLSKVALTTQMILKDVKESGVVNDIDFSKVDWNGEFIKRDLAKIGVTPTLDIVDKIRIAYAGESLKGAIFKEPQKLSEVSGLEDVYQKTIQKIYELEQDKIEREKALARNSNDTYPIDEGMKLYTTLDDQSQIGYVEFDFENSILNINRYIFKNLDFEKVDYDSGNRVQKGYILNENEWQELKDEDRYSITIKDGVAINEKMKKRYILVNQKPFSYSSFLSTSFLISASDSSKDKEYILKIVNSDDFYTLYDKTDYSSISEFISDHCGANNYFSFLNDDNVVGGISFSADSNGTCDLEATSGRLSEVNRVSNLEQDSVEQKVVNDDIGTWSIVTLPNSDKRALVIKPYNPKRYGDGTYSFYTVFTSDANLDQALWSGEYQEKGYVDMIPVINESAMEYLKTSYIEEIKKKIF